MTHNNISFLEVLEKKRSNLAQEAETHRANVAKEQENLRSNLAKEENTRYGTEMDYQARLTTAGLSKESAAAAAQIAAGASMSNARINAETQRYITDLNAQVAREQLEETGRHNLVTEDVQHTGNVIQSLRTEYDYQLGLAQLEETSLHNQVMEDYQRAKAAEEYVLGVGGILGRLVTGLAGYLGGEESYEYGAEGEKSYSLTLEPNKKR